MLLICLTGLYNAVITDAVINRYRCRSKIPGVYPTEGNKAFKKAFIIGSPAAQPNSTLNWLRYFFNKRNFSKTGDSYYDIIIIKSWKGTIGE